MVQSDLMALGHVLTTKRVGMSVHPDRKVFLLSLLLGSKIFKDLENVDCSELL